MDQKMRLFKDWVRESGSIVFFGGAGVSTESGIPDFRSTNGSTASNMITHRRRF